MGQTTWERAVAKMVFLTPRRDEAMVVARWVTMAVVATKMAQQAELGEMDVREGSLGVVRPMGMTEVKVAVLALWVCLTAAVAIPMAVKAVVRMVAELVMVVAGRARVALEMAVLVTVEVRAVKAAVTRELAEGQRATDVTGAAAMVLKAARAEAVAMVVVRVAGEEVGM